MDTAGSIGSLAFQDEDVLRYANGVWSLARDASTLDADWGAADLDAMQVPEPTGFAVWAAALSGLVGVTQIERRPRSKSISGIE